MRSQCSVIPKPNGEVLKRVTIRLGGYKNVMVDEMKIKVWLRSGMFRQILCELAVSPLPECIVGMEIMSDWETYSLPSIINLKQHRILGRQKEITTLINDRLEVLTNVLINSPECPMIKMDSSWRLTVNYRGLNKVVPPTTSTVPEMVLIVQKIQTTGDWYSVIDLAFFLIPSSKESSVVCSHMERIPIYIYCVATELFEFTSIPL